MKKIITLILISFTALIGSPASANPWKELAPDEFVLKNFPKDTTLRFVGKYMGMVQNSLQLFDFPIKLELENPKLARSLSQIVPGTTNLIIEGYLQERSNNRGGSEKVIRITSLTRGPSDVIVFESRLRQLISKKENTSSSLLRLSEKMFKSYEKFNETKLLPVLSQAIRHAYVQKQKYEDITTSENLISLLENIFNRIPQKSLEGHFYADLSKKFPGHPVIRKKLKDLGYRKRKGRWLSLAQFKQEEGFLWNGRSWVKEAEHHFDSVLRIIQEENITNLILRRRTEKEYKQLAEKGKLEIGMTHKEVALTLGFPDRVKRFKFNRTTELDQWDFSDRRVYLYRGEVLTHTEGENIELVLSNLRTLIRNGGETGTSRKK